MDKKTYNKLEQEIKELKKYSDRQRGEHIKYYVNYIRENYGEKGLKKVKDTLKEMGVEIGNVEELSDTKWVSRTIPHAFFVASVRIFDWSEKEIFELGKKIAIQSTIIKIFIKYFPSIKNTLEQGVKGWNHNFTRGKLELKEFNKKERKGKLVLKDFPTNSLACIHYQGFFARILELMTGSDNVKIKETKCMSNGAPYHEFPFEW